MASAIPSWNCINDLNDSSCTLLHPPKLLLQWSAHDHPVDCAQGIEDIGLQAS
jgi:hypothetical protein